VLLAASAPILPLEHPLQRIQVRYRMPPTRPTFWSAKVEDVLDAYLEKNIQSKTRRSRGENKQHLNLNARREGNMFVQLAVLNTFT
jgi:hypothetical protein